MFTIFLPIFILILISILILILIIILISILIIISMSQYIKKSKEICFINSILEIRLLLGIKFLIIIVYLQIILRVFFPLAKDYLSYYLYNNQRFFVQDELLFCTFGKYQMLLPWIGFDLPFFLLTYSPFSLLYL